MSNSIDSSKQQLQTIEKQIRVAAEAVRENGVAIGKWLCEIRDNHLWKPDYESWNQYIKTNCENLVGLQFSQATSLIVAAEVSKKLPDSVQSTGLKKTDLSTTAIRELGRLAPDKDGASGTQKDFRKLDKKTVASVLKAAKVIAKQSSPETNHGEAVAVSVKHVRKAVDAELGIDRKERAKKLHEENRKYEKDERERREARRKYEEKQETDLYIRVMDFASELQKHKELFAEIPEDAWTRLAQNYIDDYGEEVDVDSVTMLWGLGNEDRFGQWLMDHKGFDKRKAKATVRLSLDEGKFHTGEDYKRGGAPSKELLTEYLNIKTEQHWSTMRWLLEEAKKFYEQTQKQFAPLIKAGLLDRDLTEKELAPVLIDRRDENAELADYHLPHKPR